MIKIVIACSKSKMNNSPKYCVMLLIGANRDLTFPAPNFSFFFSGLNGFDFFPFPILIERRIIVKST